MKLDLNCGIYKIRCPDGVYIGQALNFGIRWSGHMHDLAKQRHSSPELQNAYNRHGIESFTFLVLERCQRSKLTEREQYWFDQQSEKLLNLAKVAGVTTGIVNRRQKELLGTKISLSTGETFICQQDFASWLGCSQPAIAKWRGMNISYDDMVERVRNKRDKRGWVMKGYRHAS